MPKPDYSIEEMERQIAQLRATMSMPGVPDDEKAIYATTIRRIQLQIDARTGSGPVAKPPNPTPPQPVKSTTPPAQNQNPPSLTFVNGYIQPPPPPTKKGDDGIKTRIVAPTNVPKGGKLAATIQAAHDSDPFNPIITITWADGYTFTGDETAIRGRFTSTLRDTIALKYTRERKFEKIWRWDTPWRAAGLYKALTHLNAGEPPTLADFDITRPTELTRIIFELISEAAKSEAFI